MAQRERDRATVRVMHLTELERTGQARRTALDEAERELDRIAQLLPDALQAGLSLAEIARATGVSRPTLYELRARYGASAQDLQLAVLQTVALSPDLTRAEVAEHLGRKPAEVTPVLDAFVDQGFIEKDVDLDRSDLAYWLTFKGSDLLEHWWQVEEGTNDDHPIEGRDR